MTEVNHDHINNPKIRWAQQIADKTLQDQAVVRNMFNSFDIKPARVVMLINNPNLICVIEPTSRTRGENYDE
jgi:hypothetical protein